MNNVDVKLGEIIRAKRKEMHMTQTDLANKAGTTTQCIYYYEKGTRGLSMSMFFALCDILNLDPNDIQKQVTG